MALFSTVLLYKRNLWKVLIGNRTVAKNNKITIKMNILFFNDIEMIGEGVIKSYQ